LEISGVILSDHVKSLDWKARNIRNADFAPNEVVSEVLEKLNTLMS
jgi:mRNA interferase MazF